MFHHQPRQKKISPKNLLQNFFVPPQLSFLDTNDFGASSFDGEKEKAVVDDNNDDDDDDDDDVDDDDDDDNFWKAAFCLQRKYLGGEIFFVRKSSSRGSPLQDDAAGS